MPNKNNLRFPCHCFPITEWEGRSSAFSYSDFSSLRVQGICIYSGQIKSIEVYHWQCSEMQEEKQNIQQIFSATLFLLFYLLLCSFPPLRIIFPPDWCLFRVFTSCSPLTLDVMTMDPTQSQLHLLLNMPLGVQLLVLNHPLNIFSWNSWVSSSFWAQSCQRLPDSLHRTHPSHFLWLQESIEEGGW